jgi:hypothetical protein
MIPFPIALRNVTEPCSQPYDWFSYCLRHYDELRKAPLPNWRDSLVSKEPQPVWDTNDPFSEIDREEPKLSSEREDPRSAESMDVLAWYSPWHGHTNAEYGIHLPAVGIVRLADILEDKLANRQGAPKLSCGARVLWAAHILYCHELCHGWIEQWVYDAEILSGKKDIYLSTQERFGSCILMEEALCNTAVYGMQRSVFFGRRGSLGQVPSHMRGACVEIGQLSSCQQRVLLEALAAFMRAQPLGYKDFSEIREFPTNSPPFIANAYLLLTRVYGCEKASAIAVLERFVVFQGVYLLNYEDDKLKRVFAPLMYRALPEAQITIPTHFHVNDACENGLCGAPKSQSYSTKNPVCFEVDGSFYVINAIDVLELDIPKEIDGNLYFIGCQFDSFHNIHMKVKKISEDIVLIDSEIGSAILGILAIEELKQVKVCGEQSSEFKKAINIVNTHLKKERDLLDCQDELLDAGLLEYAQM